MELNLLTLGEVFDSLEIGKSAVCIYPEDQGAILSVDNQGWLKIKYPNREYFTYDINIIYGKNVKEKRWILIDTPKKEGEE